MISTNNGFSGFAGIVLGLVGLCYTLYRIRLQKLTMRKSDNPGAKFDHPTDPQSLDIPARAGSKADFKQKVGVEQVEAKGLVNGLRRWLQRKRATRAGKLAIQIRVAKIGLLQFVHSSDTSMNTSSTNAV